MSSSDEIKILLDRAYPEGATSGSWKRTSKKKDGDTYVRTFKHTSLNIEVTVLEDANGKYSIQNETTAPAPVAKPVVPAPAIATKPVIPAPAAQPGIATQILAAASTPTPVKSTNKAPNKKALMKKGTEWVVTEDVTIYVLWDNPQYDAARQAVYKRFPRGGWGNAMDAIPYPERIPTKSMDLKKGTVLKVFGAKLIPDTFGIVGPGSAMSNGHGVQFEMEPGANVIYTLGKGFDYYGWQAKLDKGKIKVIFPYKAIEKYVELQGEAEEQYIYLLRDSATGLYYKTTHHHARHYVTNPEYQKWQNARQQITGPHGPGFNIQAGYDWEEKNPAPLHGGYRISKHITNPADCFEWETKVTKAKQYADLGRMKSSILTFTGYTAGLEEDTTSEGDQYLYMMQDQVGDEGYPFLPTFEAVKVEKFSKREVEVIDLQAWYKRTMSLRRLTATYGSAVRSLYDKLEKAGELTNWSYAVFFRTGQRDQWGDRILPISDDQIANIDESIKIVGLEPKKLKRVKAQGSLAVATNSIAAAMGLKLGASDLDVRIIDFNTMNELVQES